MYKETDRLVIRPCQEEDFADVFSLVSNPEVMRFSVSGPLSKEKARQFFEQRILGHYAQYGFGLWAVCLKKSGLFIGLTGLMMQEVEGESLVELGYRFDPRYAGQGFATEAAGAVLEHTFTDLKLDRLICIIDPRNVRSATLALRLGMHVWKKTTFHQILVDVYMLEKIALSSVTSTWSAVFAEEKEALIKAFQGLSIDFHHIGSTALEDFTAKPILDVLGVTPDIFAVDEYNDALCSLGFFPLGEFGMPGRRYFKRMRSPKIHLHVFASGDPDVGRHLRFISYLKAHPNIAQEYAKKKEHLASTCSHSIQDYTLGKSSLIKKIDYAAALAAHPSPPTYSPQKKQWNRAEILYAMDVNIHLHMTCFAKYIPTLDLVYAPDVSIVQSAIPDDTFNYVLQARFTAKNASSKIQEVSDLFTKKGLPFSWWVGEHSTPHPLGEYLLGAGFQEKETNIGMYLSIQDKIQVPSSSLHFVKAESLDTLQDFCSVIVRIGEHPLMYEEIYAKIPSILYSQGAPFALYVGYIDGKPCTTGILVTHVGVAGIYYIATIPERRKQGYGTSMMYHLLQQAEEKGYAIATLQASAEGLPLYEKIGFIPIAEYKEYARV